MLAQSEPKDQAMYLVLQAIACILHLENQVGLKSIESILRPRLSNAQNGELEWTDSRGTDGRQEQYIKVVQSKMRMQILGTPSAPSQWRFPLNDDGSMGSLSMDNNRTRLVMYLIEILIEILFPDNEKKLR